MTKPPELIPGALFEIVEPIEAALIQYPFSALLVGGRAATLAIELGIPGLSGMRRSEATH
jgi:hypothetical protein